MLDKKKIMIVGLGLIGGSYAMGLKSKGHKVSAIDPNEESVKYALENNIVDSAYLMADENNLKDMDIIIMCLYPSLEINWVKDNQKYLKQGTIIMDVSGVKANVVDNIQTILNGGLEFISTHPMAGRELSGIFNSDPSIFINANYIVVPTEKNSIYAIDLAKQLGNVLGFKRISELSIKEHDEIIGFVSQLTHIIAISLMTCNDDQNLELYTGDSFRDLTRIARINENMWYELFVENKKELIKQIDSFIGQLTKIRTLISDEKEFEMKEIMNKSTRRRALFDKK